MPGPWTDLRGWRLLAAAAVLLAGGFLNDPPWKFYEPDMRLVPNGESQRVAVNLLHQGSFANPFQAAPTGPTAHVAPGYPFLTAALLRLFGEGAAGVVAIRVLATGALSLQFALLPWLARRLGYSPWTGVLAGLFGILVKPGREEMWEAHLAGLLTLLLAAAMHAWTRREVAMRETAPCGRGSASGPLDRTPLRRRAPLAEPRPEGAVPPPSSSASPSAPAPSTWTHAAGLGVAAGLAFLVQPVIAAVYLPWAAVRSTHRALLLAIPLLVCAPWIARTWIATGGPAFIRDDLGLELYVSFNGCAPYGIRQSERLGCASALHPNTNPEEAAAVATLSEYRYNQRRLRTALAWIAAHPLRSAALIGQRVWFFWFPSDAGWRGYLAQRKRTLALHLLTLLSVAGFWISCQRGLASVPLLTLWLEVFPLIYYAVQFEARYRYPILWITLLLAACAVTAPLARSPRETLSSFLHPK